MLDNSTVANSSHLIIGTIKILRGKPSVDYNLALDSLLGTWRMPVLLLAPDMKPVFFCQLSADANFVVGPWTEATFAVGP
jgi:hypothetical protein